VEGRKHTEYHSIFGAVPPHHSLARILVHSIGFKYHVFSLDSTRRLLSLTSPNRNDLYDPKAFLPANDPKAIANAPGIALASIRVLKRRIEDTRNAIDSLVGRTPHLSSHDRFLRDALRFFNARNPMEAIVKFTEDKDESKSEKRIWTAPFDEEVHARLVVPTIYGMTQNKLEGRRSSSRDELVAILREEQKILSYHLKTMQTSYNILIGNIWKD
jgi:hypothetical protein